MKRTFYFLTVLLLTGLIVSSCQKDSESNNAPLRITKIADNQSMENPWYVFEYDDNGLLKRISSESTYSSYTGDIEYNANKKPTKVISTYYYNGSIEDERTTNIEWIINGFIILNENNYESTANKFELDSNGRIVKMTETYTQNGVPQTNLITGDWTGEESLILRYSQSSSNLKFIKKNNPFSGIDLAVVMAAELGYGEWDCDFQNKFCLSEWNEEEDGLSAEVTYQFNEQDYPLVADIKYVSEEGTAHDYVYFKYE